MVDWVKLKSNIEKLHQLPLDRFIVCEDYESASNLPDFLELDTYGKQCVEALFTLGTEKERKVLLAFNQSVLDDLLVLLSKVLVMEKESAIRLYLSALWADTMHLPLNIFTQSHMPFAVACLDISQNIRRSDEAICQIVAPTIKKLIANAESLRDGSEDDGVFFPHQFLVTEQGNAIFQPEAVFNYVGLGEFSLFPAPHNHNVSENHLKKVYEQAPLLDLTDADRCQLMNCAPPVSINLYRELERRHLALFDEKRSVYTLFDELQRALLASSIVGGGVDGVADLRACSAVIIDFYHQWKALPVEMRQQVISYSVKDGHSHAVLDQEVDTLVDDLNGISPVGYGREIADEQSDSGDEEEISVAPPDIESCLLRIFASIVSSDSLSVGVEGLKGSAQKDGEKKGGIVLSEAELKRVLREDVFPCAHQIGQYIQSFIRENPELRQLYLDEGGVLEDAIEFMKKDVFQASLQELNHQIVGGCGVTAFSGDDFDIKQASYLRDMVITVVRQGIVNDVYFRMRFIKSDDIFERMFLRMSIEDCQQLLERIKSAYLRPISLVELARVIKGLSEYEREGFVQLLDKKGLLPKITGSALSSLFVNFGVEAQWKDYQLKHLFSSQIKMVLDDPTEFMRFYVWSINTHCWVEAKSFFSMEVAPYFSNPEKILAVLNTGHWLANDFLLEVFQPETLPFEVKAAALGAWIAALKMDKEGILSEVITRGHFERIVPNLSSLVDFLSAFSSNSLPLIIDVLSEKISQWVTSTDDFAQLIGRFSSVSARLIKVMRDEAAGFMKVLLSNFEKQKRRKLDFSLHEQCALDALCRFVLCDVVSPKLIENAWKKAKEEMVSSRLVVKKGLTPAERNLHDMLTRSIRLGRVGTQQGIMSPSQFITTWECITDICQYFEENKTDLGRFGSRLAQCLNIPLLQKLKGYLLTMEERHPALFETDERKLVSDL